MTDPISSTATHLLFLHIQKTAGSTFENIIRRQYPRDKTFNIHHTSHDTEAFFQLSSAKRNSLLLLKGHFAFGLHTYMEGPSEYITLLRDPVERAISHYYHAYEDPEHFMHKQIAENNYSLTDVLEKGIMPNLDNNMVRMFSGNNRVAFGACTNEMLEAAMKNLAENFPLIGLQSHFDEFVLQCARRYQWKHFLYYRRMRVGKIRPQQKDLDEKTLRLIRQYNQLDQQLYDAWAPVVLKQLANEPASFHAAVEKFKKRNQLINKYAGWWPAALTR